MECHEIQCQGCEEEIDPYEEKVWVMEDRSLFCSQCANNTRRTHDEKQA